MTALRPLHVACLLSAAAASLACSSSSSDPNAAKSAANSPEAGATSLGEPLHLSIKVPSVAPGVENTQCIRVNLGNDAPLKIGKIHNVLSESSHHFILSTVDDPTLKAGALFDCPPFRAALTGAPLTITQKSDDTVLMPPGVAYTVAAKQLMHLELHYINLSTETRDIEATADIYPIAETGAGLQEASFLLIGDLDITIPPKSKASTGPVYQPLPSNFDGVNFYALTGHTHRFGTNVQVGTAASATSDVTSVYAPTAFNWAEPEVERLNPFVHVPSGGGFSYQCDWDNPTDSTVKFGESALTEMCFFWAYYYPKQEGSRLLLHGLDKVTGDGGAKPALTGPPCATSSDTGNSIGVGKYCTRGGIECSALTGALCLADFTTGTFGNFCTQTCVADGDCGAGASCLGTTTKVCIPTSCVASFGASSAGDAGAAP